MKKFVTIKVDAEVKAMGEQMSHLLYRRGLVSVPKELIQRYETEFGPIKQFSSNTIFGLSLLSLRSQIGK